MVQSLKEMLASEHLEASRFPRENQGYLRLFIENAPAAIAMFDQRMRYIAASRRWLIDYGLEGQNVVGRSHYQIFPKVTHRWKSCCRRGLAGEVVPAMEDSFECAGAVRWLRWELRPWFEMRSAVGGVIIFSEDITERKRAENILRESEERYRTLFDTLIEGFCTIEMVFDSRNKPVDYRFLEVNPAFERQTGLTNAKGRLMRELVPNHEAHWFDTFGKVALTGEPVHFENEAKALGRFYDVFAYRIGGPESAKVAVLFNDITGRKLAEQHLLRVNRTLKAIRDCHEAMMRAKTEKSLLDDVCRIIVETGGERMAWIGFAQDDDAKSVRAVAEAGFNRSYVAKARITWADVPRGRGPVGTAIRTGNTCLCRDTLTDPQFAPWRAAARKYGYGSMIALPLIIEREVLGALSIYARTANAFDAGEEQLLSDLANDVAYGIANLRIRRERERLEREIVGSIEREQERIGRDLHDSLCQILVGAKFRSIYLARILSSKFPEGECEARALEELLNQTIEQSRDLARGLNPVRATADGLELALQRLAASIGNKNGPHCFCRFPTPVKISDHEVAIHLYRIAQEAVQNAVKHALAKNISLSLVLQNGHLSLIVKDDGIGLPPNLRGGGMGLDNMRARAGLIGGKLEIRRRKSGGTAVKCELLQKIQKS
jgi:PAS domain S-box-containing protein